MNPLKHFIKPVRDIHSHNRHEKWTDHGEVIQCNECGKEFRGRKDPAIKGHYATVHPDKTKWTYNTEE